MPNSHLESAGFIAGLPKIGPKKLTIRFIVSLLIFIIGYFALRFLFDNLVIPLNELSPIKSYFVLSWIFYIPALIISVFCFYPEKSVLKTQFTSLSIKQLVNDTSILVLISFILSLLLNILYFSTQGESEITALLSNYKGLSKFFALNIFYFLQWVLVGFSEEIIFRGGLYRGLQSVFSKYTSLIIAAILFVLVHNFHLFSSTFIFLSAVISAFYFEKRNNLIPIILVHILQDMYIAGTTLYLSAYIVSLFI